VVDPCRFVPEYSLHSTPASLGPLGGGQSADMRLLAIVSHDGQGLTLNLKAPLVVDLRRRLGCQVVNRAEWPLGYSLYDSATPMRRSA
jgi:flagellar assembly factor FliW